MKRQTKTIEAAIANYEARLSSAVENAADTDSLPGIGTISLLRRDLVSLYEMRRDAEQEAELHRKLANVDA